MKHTKHWNCLDREKKLDRNCCVCQPHENCKDYVKGKKMDIESGNLQGVGGFTPIHAPIFGRRFA